MWKALRAPGGKVGWILFATAAVLAFIMFAGEWYGGGESLSTDLEKRLSRVLECVEGAGEVRVLVHGDSGTDAVYAWSAHSGGVIGVIVVAQGGGDALVAARLAQAAATALGIDQTRIEVFAMEREEAQ